MNAISVNGIHKTYPPNRKGEAIHALKGIDLEMEQGTIFSILGPNGAGKTTLISILTTLLFPDKGGGTILGFDLLRQRSKIREVVNVTSGNSNFTDTFSIVENLNYYGMLYGIPRSLRKAKIETLIGMFGLEVFRDTPFNQLSTGLKQRLALSKSLINNPKILFLDEPTVGLDPQISESIRISLKEINKKDGLTIILTTHQMDEAEFLSDRIAFLRGGKIIVEGGADELKRGIRLGDVIRIQYSGPPFSLDRLSSLDGILEVKVGDNYITVSVDDRRKRLDPLIRTLTTEQHIVLKDIEILEPGLEDVFLELAKTPH
jgi:ABC-2 type transport system ATP-binding protein